MNFRRLEELIPNIEDHVLQMGLFSNEEHANDLISYYMITCIEITAIQGNSLYQPTPKPHISNHYLLIMSHFLTHLSNHLDFAYIVTQTHNALPITTMYIFIREIIYHNSPPTLPHAIK